MTRTRIAGIAGLTGLLALAIWGGEYSTADWITIRRQLADERTRVAALRALKLPTLATNAGKLVRPKVRGNCMSSRFVLLPIC